MDNLTQSQEWQTKIIQLKVAQAESKQARLRGFDFDHKCRRKPWFLAQKV